MNHIALHILQPFPATCLNRDDVGAPKNFIFGGATRSRVSSQCWKRHIRLLASSNEFTKAHGYFAGDRTLRIAEDLAKKLQEKSVANSAALASFICQSFISKNASAATEGDAQDSETD